ncbi:UDP-glucose-4-epimerase [Brettanomyces nanus]|uniref:UDP-glucose-4-epimerase n=1 Tax=Eeniella nana TaxID=13502 RepID=A0A875S573_EENNA|nr:UDP-glucose-4-epimerase [Brettanomyces nanus]QPG75505.1 UDP-glucose-4-epimerase [Brettanomyces nanus]
MSYILVTGGAGYIGSHTVIELINHGYKVVIVDNLVNSSYDSVSRVEYIVKQKIPFYKIDLRDSDGLSKVFDDYPISAVIHFAALKAVGESTTIPLKYFENNVGCTISLLNVMKYHNVKTVVFSSSATVYGDATRFENMIPIPEECPTGPTNPYGHTKLTIETILKDLHASDPQWRAAILRYFNPIGAHPSGLIGEDPLGIPNNLLPFLAQVAVGRRAKLSIFGDDYESHDGTPIRDYIHVVDLAKGHIAALNYLSSLKPSQGLYREWNLGTGKGSTVFDVYHAFCRAVGHDLPYEVVGRRDGDVLNLTSKPNRANKELQWMAHLTIDDACRDLWNWTTKNPLGFHVKNYSVNEDAYGEDRVHTVEYPGFKVSIANYGATIIDIEVNGKPVVCKFDNLRDYHLPSNPCFGATIGRYANRIGGAQFTIGGKQYDVEKNEGANCLHGGSHGFNTQYFYGPIATHSEEDDSTTLKFVSFDKDGHAGFPGDLITTVAFKVQPKSLEFEFESSLSPKSSVDATVVNLTNHSYFNLCGEGTINETELLLASNNFLEVDSALLPTRSIKKWTRPDVSKPFTVGTAVFDNCFVLSDYSSKLDTRKERMVDVVHASHPGSKVKLTVSTTEPSFQLYTGDGVDTKGFFHRAGFAVEPCRFVNAARVDDWKKQVVLKKGEVYGSRIRYTFE